MRANSPYNAGRSRRHRLNQALVCTLAALSILVFARNASPGQTPPGPIKTDTKTDPKTASPAAIQRSVTIIVPEAGEKFVRILPSADAKQPADLPTSFSDTKTTITFDGAKVGKSPRLAIDDARTGNTALFNLSADDKPIEVHRSDFDHVHTVKVVVSYDNKPVQVARVTLDGADKTTQTKTLDPSLPGTALFSDVPAGKAKLTIVYGNNLTQTTDVVVSNDRPAVPVGQMAEPLLITAPVSQKVATLDTPITPPGSGAGMPGTTNTTTNPTAPTMTSPVAPGPPTQATPSGNGLLGMLGDLLAIGLVAAGCFFFYKWFQSGGLAATLKKAGIEVSGPAVPSDAGTPWQPKQAPAPVVADPTVCQFCGQKKDSAGNCACSLTGAVVSAATAAPVTASQPRLIATMGVYSGSIFPINANGTGITLGREATNSIPLGNDTTVSRRHAAIRHEKGTYIVSDAGSSNGVYVNGVRITGEQTLRPGDEVQIGNTRFRFEV